MINFILITGASSGIGRSISVKLAEKGYKCILTGRNLEKLRFSLSLLKGDGHLIFEGDLTDDDFQDFISHNTPILSGIVHSAGVIKLMPHKFIKKNDFNEIMNINFFAPFFLTQRLLKQKKNS